MNLSRRLDFARLFSLYLSEEPREIRSNIGIQRAGGGCIRFILEVGGGHVYYFTRIAS